MADGNKLLKKADCKYGAPMGRFATTTNKDAKVRLFRVRLDSGGYDTGGVYWGIGQPLYCCIGDEFEVYRRATNREAAKEDLLEEFPDLKFYR